MAEEPKKGIDKVVEDLSNLKNLPDLAKQINEFFKTGQPDKKEEDEDGSPEE